MTTRSLDISSIRFSQSVLWPTDLISKTEEGEGKEAPSSVALTVVEIGSNLVALDCNALLTAVNNGAQSITCNVYAGCVSDFYMQANYGYRLLWEHNSKLQVVAFHPTSLCALIALRCGTGVNSYPLTGDNARPQYPASLEEAARRGVVPFPESPSMDHPSAAFEALVTALATDSLLYISTSGNLYFPISDVLRVALRTDAHALIQPTVLFTYSEYTLTDLSNSEEVDDVEWVTGSYAEVIREEIMRDFDLSRHLERTYLSN